MPKYVTVRLYEKDPWYGIAVVRGRVLLVLLWCTSGEAVRVPSVYPLNINRGVFTCVERLQEL